MTTEVWKNITPIIKMASEVWLHKLLVILSQQLLKTKFLSSPIQTSNNRTKYLQKFSDTYKTFTYKFYLFYLSACEYLLSVRFHSQANTLSTYDLIRGHPYKPPIAGRIPNPLIDIIGKF